MKQPGDRTVPVPSGPLRGETVELRAWRPDDAEWYLAARDHEVFRWTTESPDLAVGAAREALRQHAIDPRWVGLAIADAVTGDLLGNIALSPTGERAGEAEISYWLAPKARGRGAASEAVSLLVTWAFEQGACHHRVVLNTISGNERSQAVARRAGFVLQHDDGTKCQFVRVK